MRPRARRRGCARRIRWGARSRGGLIRRTFTGRAGRTFTVSTFTVSKTFCTIIGRTFTFTGVMTRFGVMTRSGAARYARMLRHARRRRACAAASRRRSSVTSRTRRCAPPREIGRGCWPTAASYGRSMVATELHSPWTSSGASTRRLELREKSSGRSCVCGEKSQSRIGVCAPRRRVQASSSSTLSFDVEVDHVDASSPLIQTCRKSSRDAELARYNGEHDRAFEIGVRYYMLANRPRIVPGSGYRALRCRCRRGLTLSQLRDTVRYRIVAKRLRRFRKPLLYPAELRERQKADAISHGTPWVSSATAGAFSVSLAISDSPSRRRPARSQGCRTAD
jgi:hypothetical protein